MNQVLARLACQRPGFSLDVALDMPGRGVTAIYGASGSGKTSVLRGIAGLERMAGAYVCINGEVWQDEPRGVFTPVHRRPLGYVFQEAGLFAHLNVQGNLVYGLRRVPAASRRVALDQAIELLGIGHLLPRQTTALSGGERQRVAIARALATSPRLLLMDEPLASLDVERKAQVLPYLERLHQELAIPVLYVSHAPDEVARLADHLVLLQAGQVLASGSTREMLTRLDLPLAHGDAAAALLEATVTHTEPGYHLSHATFAGGHISLVHAGLAVGQRVRLRIQARDVSLSLHRQQDTSVLNIFKVTVASIAPDSPGQVMVALHVCGQADCLLLARITRKSADTLGLLAGLEVYAQVKGVAVLI